MNKGQKLKHKIYVACHKDFYIPESEVLFPIQVGAALAPSRFDNMLHDDVGDNISKKNRSYCELTAQYWAWKNDDSDYVVFSITGDSSHLSQQAYLRKRGEIMFVYQTTN